MKVDLGRISALLDYALVDASLFVLALTHRSAGSPNNERLEFLGDAVLDLVVAQDLYDRFPTADEGELSRMRSVLVRGDNLAKLARRLNIADHILLGTGELKSGGHRRCSILAGVLEALIGAIYLDGGFDASAKFIRAIYASEYDEMSLKDAVKDPKTRLQEYLQSRRLDLPVYNVLNISGDGHQQTFEAECRVEALTESAVGYGASRRKAEQQAAAQLLQQLTGADE